MNHVGRWVFRSVVGLSLGFLGLPGCGGDSQSNPTTGGAGIPKRRGPVSSQMPTPGTAVKNTPAGRAGSRTAPAPTPKP